MWSSMESQIDTIVTFTARSPERIIREGGSSSWVLNPVRAKQCKWLVCTQNQHNPDHSFSDATEPHGSGFLVGKISGLHKSKDAGTNRWLIAISEYARINMPNLWDGSRNPVRYTSLKVLDINPDDLEFQPMPEYGDATGQPRAPMAAAPTGPLTIAEAKKALAATFGVTPEAIEITIRG